MPSSKLAEIAGSAASVAGILMNRLGLSTSHHSPRASAASPWVLGFAHTRAMHFSIGIGSAVAFLAALELFLIFDNSSRFPSPTRR
jgi:hypothetical protein